MRARMKAALSRTIAGPIDDRVCACIIALPLLVGGVAGAAVAQPASRLPTSAEAPQLTRTVVTTGLQEPWDIAFTPDGAMLFTEKCRGVTARLADGRTVRLFGTGGSSVLAPDVFCQGQSGVHGIAVDPDFANGTRDIYVYMASSLRKPATNRVVRLTVNADYTSVAQSPRHHRRHPVQGRAQWCRVRRSP